LVNQNRRCNNVYAAPQFLETQWREEVVSEQQKQKIGVIGGGLMGHGIAYLFAAAGHPVGLFEPMADIRNSLPKRLAATPTISLRLRCRARHSYSKRRRKNCR
jgi:pyruvate/2-oxoglutarate dehydrogenase complex dihydrolipoamide dehydrogenase (E3) component